MIVGEGKERKGTVRYGKHQRTSNSNKVMPEASKKELL